MSKDKTNRKKKVVVTTDSNAKKKVKPTTARRTTRREPEKVALEFGRENYILMAAGLGLVFLGLILMAGGQMPSPDVWDEDLIYSTRRTFIAPLLILIGLGVEVYAIFKRA